ncbi:MAG: hypothetical protein NTZ62_04075 [Actinobacteria bacterium]|nr:hypothetical protein [Actinomycetota bacterium]
MNDDELDPLVLAALRDVVPASDSLREQHIAAALAEISPAEARSRFTRLSAAAAVVVLLVGATAIVRLGATSTDSNVTPRNGAITTVPVKGSACGAELADYTIVGTYSSAGSVREVWSSAQNLVVVDQASCAQLGTFTHPAATANDKKCVGFGLDAENQGVGTYSVAGTEFLLVATPSELQIRDGSCAVIASYPLPAQS